MSSGLDEVTTQEPAIWMRALERCAAFDFYHLAAYHRMAEESGEAEARLFFYSEGEYAIALPLLLRPLDKIEHFRLAANGWQDATSVYGYPGPVASHRFIPASVACNFQMALGQRLRDLRVITAFSRLNPLFDQRAVLPKDEVYPVSRTVAIDLSLPADVQRNHFRRAFKKRINQLKRLGLTVVRDHDGTHFEAFLGVYEETMRRVGASPGFFFSRIYFEKLREALGSRVETFVCLSEGKTVCAGLFLACQGILQFHLGGTLNEALKLAPMKLLVDEVRIWATEQGMQSLHLGGGVTPDPQDTLLHFKKGFSERTLEFAVWRSILFPDMYRRLCDENAQWCERQQLQSVNASFFPAYRSPTSPRISMDNVSQDREATPDSSGFYLKGKS